MCAPSSVPAIHHRLYALLPRLAPWLAAGTAFVFYALAAAPSITALFDDSLEFQLVVPTFAITHPTGYPLYTLLGGLWSRLMWPFGNWAWRTNLFSALAAAGAVGLVFALAQRLVSELPTPIASPTHPADLRSDTRSSSYSAWLRIAAGSTAALTFGLGPVWTAQATLAEVYALHNLLLAAVLWTAISLPPLHPARERFDRRMALLALLMGVGLAHHRTIVLALPGVAVYLLWSVPQLWRPRRAWLLWLAALLLPLLLYLYLPLRAVAGATDLHGSYTNTWAGFWEHALASGYGGFFTPSPLSVERSPQQWLALALAQVGWVGGLLAVIGCIGVIDRRSRKERVMVLLVLGTNLLFALAYRVADQEVFMLPVFLCLSLLSGNGAAILFNLLARLSSSPSHPLTLSPTHLLIALILAALLLWNPGRGPVTNRSGDWVVHDYAVDMAKVAYPPGAVVLGLEGEVTALRYMQSAEGLGVNAAPVAVDDPQARRAALAAALASGSPTYLTRELEGIAADYSFSGEGPLVRVWPRGEAQTDAPQHPLDLPLDGGNLLLTGYNLQQLDWAGGPALRLNLYWQPTTVLTQTLKTSIRFLGADGAPLTYADGSPAVFDQFPLVGIAPTTAWLPNETVRDTYTFYLPPSAAEATLQVIVYDAATLAEIGRWEVSRFLQED